MCATKENILCHFSRGPKVASLIFTCALIAIRDQKFLFHFWHIKPKLANNIFIRTIESKPFVTLANDTIAWAMLEANIVIIDISSRKDSTVVDDPYPITNVRI